jgi:hypothetical protein
MGTPPAAFAWQEKLLSSGWPLFSVPFSPCHHPLKGNDKRLLLQIVHISGLDMKTKRHARLPKGIKSKPMSSGHCELQDG